MAIPVIVVKTVKLAGKVVARVSVKDVMDRLANARRTNVSALRGLHVVPTNDVYCTITTVLYNETCNELYLLYHIKQLPSWHSVPLLGGEWRFYHYTPS